MTSQLKGLRQVKRSLLHETALLGGAAAPEKLVHPPVATGFRSKDAQSVQLTLETYCSSVTRIATKVATPGNVSENKNAMSRVGKSVACLRIGASELAM